MVIYYFNSPIFADGRHKDKLKGRSNTTLQQNFCIQHSPRLSPKVKKSQSPRVPHSSKTKQK